MSVLLSWVFRLTILATLVLAFAWALNGGARRISPRLRKFGLVVVLLSVLGVVLWVALGRSVSTPKPVARPPAQGTTSPDKEIPAPIVEHPGPRPIEAPRVSRPALPQVKTPNTANVRVFFGT